MIGLPLCALLVACSSSQSPPGACATNADCASSSKGPVCVVGFCAQCAADSECTAGKKCNAGDCVDCIVDGDCGPRSMCVANACTQLPPDLSMPDFTMPDLTMPDLTMQSLTMPDFVMANVTHPDLAIIPDLGAVTPDMTTAPPMDLAPACVPFHVSCSKTSDCCQNAGALTCPSVFGFCHPACGLTFEACPTAGCCGTPYASSQLQCLIMAGGSTACCKKVGDACSGSGFGDCCGFATCNGTCTCVAPLGSCYNNQDCCSGTCKSNHACM